MSIELLADAGLLRWPVGQRWCYVAATIVSSRPPRVGALVDDRGRPLAVVDLARLFHVDRSTVERFRERVLETGRMLELGGELVWTTGALTVDDLVGPAPRAAGDSGKSLGKSRVNTPGKSAQVSHDDGAPSGAAHSPDPHPPADPGAFPQDQHPLQLQSFSTDLDQELLVAAAARTVPAGDETALSDLELARMLARIGDATERTTLALVGFRHAGVPPAAFYRALEALERRRARRPRLGSEAAYVVATISRLRPEYAR